MARMGIYGLARNVNLFVSVSIKVDNILSNGNGPTTLLTYRNLKL